MSRDRYGDPDYEDYTTRSLTDATIQRRIQLLKKLSKSLGRLGTALAALAAAGMITAFGLRPTTATGATAIAVAVETAVLIIRHLIDVERLRWENLAEHRTDAAMRKAGLS